MAPKKHNQAGDKTTRINEAKRAKLIVEQATRIAEWAAQALIAAEKLGIKHETVEGVLPQEGERAIVVLLPAVSAKLKKKVLQNRASDIPFVWRGNGPVRPRTWAASSATLTSWSRSRTRTTISTKKCWDGSAASSIPKPLTR